MAEYYGSDFINVNIKATAAITAIVGTNIFSARLIPEKVTSKKTINFYTISGFDGSLGYFSREWSIDCRSDNEQESKDIAYLVFEVFNRYKAVQGDYTYYAKCTVESTLPPLNDADVYNTPVTILLRRK